MRKLYMAIVSAIVLASCGTMNMTYRNGYVIDKAGNYSNGYVKLNEKSGK